MGIGQKLYDISPDSVKALGFNAYAAYLRWLREGPRLAETPNEFVYQIERVLSDGPLRKRLAAAGRGLVEREYSWSVAGKSLMEAYENASHVRSVVST